MLTKCESCGKFFGADQPTQKLCSACSVTGSRLARHIADSGDPKFVIARDVVYDNPEISPEDLRSLMNERGIDISVREIMSYVKEGRLSIKNAPQGSFCEECGRTISSGRMCPICAGKLEKAIASKNDPRPQTTKEVKGGHGPIMHTKGKPL